MATRGDKWTDLEMTIVLAYYVFENNVDDKKKQIILANKLNSITGKNRTGNAIGLRVANYKSVNPQYNNLKAGLPNGGAYVQKFWDKYIVNDPSRSDLATIYSNFLNGATISNINQKPTSVTSTASAKTKTITSVVYNRSETVKNATLIRAGGVCEFCMHPAPFKNESNGEPYLEVHHFIPLSEGGVDATSNTLALCPNCHRRLHYGPKLKNKEKNMLLSKMI